MVDKKKLALSRRKILAGLGVAGAASAGAGLGTTALFSDEESFEDNSITAGTTNLIVEASVANVSTTNEDTGATPSGDGLYVDIQDNTADGSPAVGLTVADMKPGDSFTIRVTVEVEDNPMYVAATVANADDSENRPNPEPENATQNGGSNPDVEDGSGAGNGSDTVGDGTGDDAGDLDNRLLATFGYDGDQTSGGSADRTLDATSITPDPGLGFDGSSSATATSFIDALQGGGLVYRGQAGGTADPPGGHRDSGSPTRIGGNISASNVDREQVTHFIKFELPASVGNEVQGDSFSFDLGFEAEQVRNNPDPLGTSGGTGPTQITSPGSGTDFATSLSTGSPTIAGEPGYNSNEGRAWILPESGGSVTQGTELTGSQPGDRVGESVDVDGNTAVVGAPGAREIHVYERSSSSANWPSTPTTTINAPNLGGGPFGIKVGIEGDAIVTLGDAYGPGGNVGIIVYKRQSSGSWDQVNQFVDVGQPPGDIATDGDIAIIVDRKNDDVWSLNIPSGKTGSGPSGLQSFGPSSSIPGYGQAADVVTTVTSFGAIVMLPKAFIGAQNKVYVYSLKATSGGTSPGGFASTPLTTLTPSSGATGVGFGTSSLSAEGLNVAIGAPGEGGGGVVYLFGYTGSSALWKQTRRITAPSGASNFGRELALSSTTLYVGATTSGSGTVYTYSV